MAVRNAYVSGSPPVSCATLEGTSKLRGIPDFDETYGLIRPHPYNPPTKCPLVRLMKQARASVVGRIVATQNPMDPDYRVLSNAGTWFIDRLQTEPDGTRVIEGLGEKKRGDIDKLVQKVADRWFVVRTAGSNEVSLMQPRWAISLLRGPMTPQELRRTSDRDESEGL